MKRIIKNITTTIVAITILFSTIGLQVYSHSCKTHNFFASSFIEKPECENDHQTKVVDNCCSIEEVEAENCCDVDENPVIDYPIIKSIDNSCCVTTIKNSYTIESLSLIAEKKINSSIADFCFTELIKSEKQNSNQIIKINSSDLPPPIFGKTLLKTIHQLKLDTPFC